MHHENLITIMVETKLTRFSFFIFRVRKTFMSIDTPVTDSIAHVQVRKAPASPKDMMEHYKDAIRQEIREQELASLVTELAHLRAILERQNATVRLHHEEQIGELKRLARPAPASEDRLQALAKDGLHSRGTNPHDSTIPEGFEIVATAFLDLVDITNMLNAAIVKRRPLNAQVRAVYNNKGQRELHFMRKGVYGLNPNMYNACLTLVTDDPDLGPYVKGEYLEHGQLVSMSPDQIERICEETLAAVRDLWDAMREQA
jgi:hypothetical protein